MRARAAPVDLRLRRRVRHRSSDRVTEYVDHLHEHFVDPCVVKDGAYVLPRRPGYSAEMYEMSLATYAFPNGTYWANEKERTSR